MDKNLFIYICGSLVPEVSHLLRNGDYPDVTLRSFPSICIGSYLTDDKISEIVAKDEGKYSTALVFVSSCRDKIDSQALAKKKIKIIRLEQCFEILFPLDTIFHFAKQGNYILSKGWLRNYKKHIKEWGFNEVNSKTFFKESMKQLMLLDTGLPGEYKSRLQDFSEYTGLKYSILPIGNSYLKNYIESLIYSWRKEKERAILNQRISEITHETADYKLVFYHLQKLISLTGEEIIINEIFKLLEILFAPKQIIYKPSDLQYKEIAYKHIGSEFNLDKNRSFDIKISFANENLGTIEIKDVMFPEYISKYREMTDTISMMTGLAVSNARKYTLLEKAKSEIAKSELFFKTIFSEAPIGIALIDSYSGQILEVNSKFAQIAGRTIEEMVKIDWMQITHPDDVQKDLDNMALLNAGKINGFQMEKRYLLPDDSWVWILMTIAPVMVQEKDYKRHLCMIDDITEWKKYEAQILETNVKLKQVIAEKDKFFSIISHDLRSPLASVVSLLEMMTENFSEFPPEELYRFISNSFKTANSLFHLLENLLEWSRLQLGVMLFKPEVINLKSFIGHCDQTTADLAMKKQINLDINVPEKLFVFADSNMLHSILRNLVTNSIKFTKEGGKIEIRAYNSGNDMVKVSVRDNGIGMTNSTLEKLFHIEFNVSRPGTNNEPSSGLGLLLCKEFVEKHGGSISVESKESEGSCFCFTLPEKENHIKQN